MTTREIVEKYRHEIGGLVADAGSSHRSGGELAMFLRLAFTRIDRILVCVCEDADPNRVAKPTLNPQPQPRKGVA